MTTPQRMTIGQIITAGITDPHAVLEQAKRVRREVEATEEKLGDLIALAVHHGATWAQIGRELGCPAERVRYRYKEHVQATRPVLEEVSA